MGLIFNWVRGTSSICRGVHQSPIPGMQLRLAASLATLNLLSISNAGFEHHWHAREDLAGRKFLGSAGQGKQRGSVCCHLPEGQTRLGRGSTWQVRLLAERCPRRPCLQLVLVVAFLAVARAGPLAKRLFPDHKAVEWHWTVLAMSFWAHSISFPEM